MNRGTVLHADDVNSAFAARLKQVDLIIDDVTSTENVLKNKSDQPSTHKPPEISLLLPYTCRTQRDIRVSRFNYRSHHMVEIDRFQSHK